MSRIVHFSHSSLCAIENHIQLYEPWNITAVTVQYDTDLTLLPFKEDGKETCSYTVGGDLCRS